MHEYQLIKFECFRQTFGEYSNVYECLTSPHSELHFLFWSIQISQLLRKLQPFEVGDDETMSFSWNNTYQTLNGHNFLNNQDNCMLQKRLCSPWKEESGIRMSVIAIRMNDC